MKWCLNNVRADMNRKGKYVMPTPRIGIRAQKQKESTGAHILFKYVHNFFLQFYLNKTIYRHKYNILLKVYKP